MDCDLAVTGSLVSEWMLRLPEAIPQNKVSSITGPIHSRWVVSVFCDNRQLSSVPGRKGRES